MKNSSLNRDPRWNLGVMLFTLVQALLVPAITQAQITKTWIYNGDVAANNSWGRQASWAPNNTIVPNGPDYFTYIGDDITGNRVITLDGNRTVGLLYIGDLNGVNTFTLAEGTGGTLTFDGTGDNAFLLKNRGGQDEITVDMVLTDNLLVRQTIAANNRQLNLSGSLSGDGDLVATSMRNGRISLTGNQSGWTGDLVLYHRGSNQADAHQVRMNVSAAGTGDVYIGNGSAGGSGFAVLELDATRTNLNQISDTATVYMNGVGGRQAYLKLMGKNETIGRLVSTDNGGVIENRQREDLGSNSSVLTVAGNGDSSFNGIFRNSNYNPFLTAAAAADATEMSNYNANTIGLTKAGTGSMTLEGNNIYYTGLTTISAGTLVLDDTTRFRSNIVNNSELVIKGDSGTWTFDYDDDGDENRTPAVPGPSRTPRVDLTITGTGNLTKVGNGIFRLESGSNQLGNVRVEQGGLVLAGSGNVINNLTLDGDPSQNRDLTLSGSNTITGNFIANGEYGAGSGVMTITGAQTITGAVELTNIRTVLSGNGRLTSPSSITLAGRSVGSGSSGRLELNNSGTINNNRIGDSTDINSRGGTILFDGGAATNEMVGTLSLVTSNLEFETAGTGTLTFSGALNRSKGTTLFFADTTLGTSASRRVMTSVAVPVPNQVLGYANVGIASFATYGANGFTAFTGGVANQTQASWTATSHVDWTNLPNQAVTTNRTVGSLNLQQTADRTITINNGVTLTVDTGGIISNPANNGNDHFIRALNPSDASFLTAGATSGYELFFHTHAPWVEGVEGNDSRKLQVSAKVSNNGANAVAVTKTGQGLLDFSNPTNTYTGKTSINAGILRIAGENSLGSNPVAFAADHLTIAGGTLRFNDSFEINDVNRGVTIGLAGGRIEVGSTETDAFAAAIESPINAQGVVEFAVRPVSTLTLGTPLSSNNYTRGVRTDLYNGVTVILGNNTIGGVFSETGTLTLTGNNAITGGVRINGGTVELDGANTYAGGEVTVSGGRLRLMNASALGTGGFSLNVGNNVVGAVVELMGTDQKLTALTGGSEGSIRNEGATNSIITFDFDRSRTFAGKLEDSTKDPTNFATGGTLGFTKVGPGTLALTGTESSFTGPVRIEEGTVSVRSLDYTFFPSSLGAGSADAGAVVLDGGTLDMNLDGQYFTDRSFTLGTEGGTLSATGANRTSTITFGVVGTFSTTPDIAFEGVGSRTLTLAGFNTGYNRLNLTLNDSGGLGEESSLLKIGSGTWEISKAQNYSGLTTVENGRLAVSVDGALGSTAQGVNLIGGNLELKNVDYTTPEAIFFNGGQLFAAADTQNSWSGDWWVNTSSTIVVEAGAEIDFRGVLRGERNLQINGEGTVRFSGSADPQAGTGWDNGNRNLQVRAGELILDYSLNNGSKLPDQTSVTLGGGSQGGIIRLVGGSHLELTAGTTVIDSGYNQIYRDSGTAKIRLNDFRRLSGGTLYIDQERIVQTDFDNINGIIGGWATVRTPSGLSWAVKDGTDADNDRDIIGLQTYVIDDLQALGNTDVQNSFTETPGQSANTIRFNTPGDITLTLSGGANEITTGGILVTPTVGQNTVSIAGPGALHTGNAVSNRNNTGAEANLIFNQFNENGALIVTAPIIDNPNVIPSRNGTFTSTGDNRRINGIVGGTADLYLGMEIIGPGIPVGAVISNVVNGTDIQINVPHSLSGATETLSFVHHNGVGKTGPGLMALLGDHSFSGAVAAADGTLLIDRVANAGVASGLGAGTAAPTQITFSGGEIFYVGEDASTDRGFQVTESARWSVGHEAATLTLNGNISGDDQLQKGGPGRLVLTLDAAADGSAAPLTSYLLDEGTLELRSSDRNNRFAATLADVTLQGGDLHLVGDPTANRVEQLGGQFQVNTGSSEVRVTSQGDGIQRDIRLELNGVDEVNSVIRNRGGTVHFVEEPTATGGDASIVMLSPLEDRQRILPWATYENTFDSLSRNSEVNNFAATTFTGQDVVSADSLSLHDIGSGLSNADLWLPSDNPSEGAAALGAIGGTLTGNREIQTLRYILEADGTVDTNGNQLRISRGGILVGYNARNSVKGIDGTGTLTGGYQSDDGQRDIIMHNYNQSQAFSIGASIVDDERSIANDGTITAGSDVLTIGFGSGVIYNQLTVGMSVTGPGIAPGTVIAGLNDSSGFNEITLSQVAESSAISQTYDFTDVVHFTQAGTGTTRLSGNNTYTGDTFATGGVLRLGSANAIPGGIGATGGTGGLIIDGGVVGLEAGDFSRALGTGAGQVEIRSSGGFAAYGADRVVNFGGASDLVVWGAGNFVPTASSLVVGSHDSTHQVSIINPIDLSAVSQVVRAEDGFGAVDGELAGVISGDAQLIKRGLGQLRLAASNTYRLGTAVEEGSLIVANVANGLGDSAGALQIGDTSFTRVTGELDVVFEGGSIGNEVIVGNLNTQGNTQIGFTGDTTLAGAVELKRDTFFASSGTAVTGTLSGAVTGVGRLTVLDEGLIELSNGSNTFGAVGGVPGTAVNGGAVVRSGALVASATGALGTVTVELGDALPQVLQVDTVTTGRALESVTGSFREDHNGLFPTTGPGAFLAVSNVVDGVTYNRGGDEGKRILIKDENGDPSKNGIYEVVFFDIPVSAPDPQPVNTMNLVRVADFDEGSEMTYGTRIDVANGTVGAGTSQFVVNSPTTVNTDAIQFREDRKDADVALFVGAAGVDVTNQIDINATNGTGSTSLGGSAGLASGEATFSGNVVLQDLNVGVQETKTVTLTSATSSSEGVTFAGLFSEADAGVTPTDDVLSILKMGSGTATLTAANTYGGTTTIGAGTLLVNNATGSGTGLGLVTVDGGATLGGRGTIGGNTSVVGSPSNLATLAPGTPSDLNGIGTLTFNQQLTLGPDAQVLFTLGGNGVNDKVIANTLTVDPAVVFKVTLTSLYESAIMAGHSFDLFDWSNVLVLDASQLELPDLSLLSGSLVWDTSEFGSTGRIIVGVPEPAKGMLIGFGLLVMVLRRRRA